MNVKIPNLNAEHEPAGESLNLEPRRWPYLATSTQGRGVRAAKSRRRLYTPKTTRN